MGADNRGWHLAGLMLAWLCGVALQLQERALGPVGAYVACVAGGTVLMLAAGTWRRGLALALLGVASLAFGATGWRAADRLALALPASLEGRDLQVTGVVAGLPQRSASGLRFRFAVEAAQAGNEAVALPPLLSIGWMAGFHEDATLTPPQQSLGAGQRWRFTLRLRQPHGNLNPHGFDYELHLFEQGVGALGSVRDAPVPPQLLERSAGQTLERWRQRVRDAIDAGVADRRAAGVLAALSVGDQSAIDRWVSTIKFYPGATYEAGSTRGVR